MDFGSRGPAGCLSHLEILTSLPRAPLIWQSRQTTLATGRIPKFSASRGACSSCAMPGSRAATCSVSVWVHLNKFPSCTWYSEPEVDFCPALRRKWPRSSSTTVVVCAMLVLMVSTRLVLLFPSIVGWLVVYSSTHKSMLQLRYLP